MEEVSMVGRPQFTLSEVRPLMQAASLFWADLIRSDLMELFVATNLRTNELAETPML
jgi:hypothetical protein